MSKDEQIVVVGASGFGRECLDVLDALIAAGARIEILGVVDDHPSKVNLTRLLQRGVAYLGSIADWLSRRPVDSLFVLGIGDPAIRRRLVVLLEEEGVPAFTAIHPSATIGACTSIALGAVVCAGATLSTNVQVGRFVHVNPQVTIGHDTVLGDFVSVNPGAVVSGEVVVQDGVLIGASATILQQLSVGSLAIVGAAALVTKDVPMKVVVKGVPGAWNA